MKHIAWIAAAGLVCASFAHGNWRDDEKAAVERVAALYFRGAETHDASLFEAAFAPEADMKYVRRGEDGTESVRVVPIAKAIEGWVDGEPQPTEGRILDVEVIDGSLALVELEILFKGRLYLDCMTLYKVNGEWRIVSKTFVRRGEVSDAGEPAREGR